MVYNELYETCFKFLNKSIKKIDQNKSINIQLINNINKEYLLTPNFIHEPLNKNMLSLKNNILELIIKLDEKKPPSDSTSMFYLIPISYLIQPPYSQPSKLIQLSILHPTKLPGLSPILSPILLEPSPPETSLSSLATSSSLSSYNLPPGSSSLLSSYSLSSIKNNIIILSDNIIFDDLTNIPDCFGIEKIKYNKNKYFRCKGQLS